MSALLALSLGAAERLRARRPEVEAIFLASSVLAGRATPSSDVDLRAVLPAPPPRRHAQDAWLEDGVLFECTYFGWDDFADVDRVLGDWWLAPNLLGVARILFDPSGRLDAVRRNGAARYREGRWVRARCRHAAAEAERFLAAARAAVAGGDALAAAEALVCAHALLIKIPPLLRCEQPTGRRALLLLRDAAAALGRPDLFATAVDALGAGGLAAADLGRLIGVAERAYLPTAAAQPPGARFAGILNPIKRDYRFRGMEEMVREGHGFAAAAPLVQVLLCEWRVLTSGAAVAVNGESKDGVAAALRTFGLLDLAPVGARIALADGLRDELLAAVDALAAGRAGGRERRVHDLEEAWT